jgi:hypothetical protein
MVSKWWISCRIFTVQVNVLNNNIVWAAPIVRRFVGQPLNNLRRWAKGFPPYQEEPLSQQLSVE